MLKFTKTIDMLNGKDILISTDGNVIASTNVQSHEIDIDTDVINVATPTGGGWKGSDAGISSWGFNTTFLVTRVKDVVSLAGKKFDITIINRQNPADRLYGRALCSTAKITANIKHLVKGAFKFVGDGKLYTTSDRQMLLTSDGEPLITSDQKILYVRDY